MGAILKMSNRIQGEIMKFSFAITAFNEFSSGRNAGEYIKRCLKIPSIHPLVDEIVVVDDASECGPKLKQLLLSFPKVRFFSNNENLGVFGNKLEAIAQCKNKWVINCDSDNSMSIDYIDRAYNSLGKSDTWLCPSFARPKFDYRHLVGLYSIETIKGLLQRPRGDCLLNTGNQVVHRENFMLVFGKYRGKRFDLMQPNYLSLSEEDRNKEHWRQVFNAYDSFIFNLEWLKAGNKIHVVDGLEYSHQYSRGEASNYARAPAEKANLAKRLEEELKRCSPAMSGENN
jgi:glycosyltransferase involved in cell wall biosynthesis